MQTASAGRRGYRRLRVRWVDTADVLGVVADRTELTGSASVGIANNVSVFGSIGQTIATTDQNGAGTTVSGGISVLLTPSLFK